MQVFVPYIYLILTCLCLPACYFLLRRAKQLSSRYNEEATAIIKLFRIEGMACGLFGLIFGIFALLSFALPHQFIATPLCLLLTIGIICIIVMLGSFGIFFTMKIDDITKKDGDE